jgi:hypothetical protein
LAHKQACPSAIVQEGEPRNLKVTLTISPKEMKELQDDQSEVDEQSDSLSTQSNKQLLAFSLE